MTLETLDRVNPQAEQWPNINPDSVIKKVSGFFDGVNIREAGTQIKDDLEIVVIRSAGGNSHVETEGYLAIASRGETKIAEEFHVTRKPERGLTDYYRLYGNNNGIDTRLEVFQFASGAKEPLFNPAVIQDESVIREFIKESVALLLNS